MQEFSRSIEYKGKEYKMYFNFNVIAAIQKEYGTLEKWFKLTDGTDKNAKEIDIEAVIFGCTEMFNEGIDIENEESGTNVKPLTRKRVGRMLTEVGVENATKLMTETVVESSQSTEKNA